MVVKRTWLRKELGFQSIIRARNWETRSSNKTQAQVSSVMANLTASVDINIIWFAFQGIWKWNEPALSGKNDE